MQILAYIGKGPVPVSPEALREALQRLMPDHAEEIMQGFGQKYLADSSESGDFGMRVSQHLAGFSGSRASS